MLTIFKEIFTWWNHQTLGTRIQTFFYGKYVGKDEKGNKYYQSNSGKRWVIYNGEIEASKIPPHWHAWLHKSVAEPPLNYKHKHTWQKDHQQNLTGTNDAYFPDSHPLVKSSETKEIKKDYESWSP